MRAHAGLALLLTAFFAFSGCLGEATQSLEDAAADRGGASALLRPFTNPIVLSHEHDDLAEHTLANNMELVGRDAGILPGGVGEIDTAGDHAYVALIGFGFAIVDISDPAAPKTVSRTKVDVPQTPQFGAYTADLKVDRSGNWVFLAMELSTTPGVLIYDATNKAAPKLAGFWAAPGKLLGCHMIEYAIVGDNEYLFCAPLDAAIYVGLILPPTPAGREIAHVARWVPGNMGWLQEQSRAPQTAATNLAGSGHDDMTFQPDPLTSKPTLFVSFWDLGVWFIDVSVPANPTTLGYWDGQSAQFYRGAIHTTMAYKVEDKRIVAAIPEGANPPALFLIDATDFARPKLLSEWKAMQSFKDDQGADHAGTFSMHNFQVVEGRIYIAMYHAAIWVIDASTPELLLAPQPLGSYQPHEPRADGEPYSVGAWDVVVHNGYTLTGDGNGGFYVLHYLGDPAGEPAHSSFA